MTDTNQSLQSMQKEVDMYIQQFKAGYFSPLSQMARLTEEVGELAREINHYYGEKPKKMDEKPKTVSEELGDVLFVTMIMANSLDIDLTEAFQKIWKNSINGINIVLNERMDEQMIKILVAGFKGKMGATATKMVLDHKGFELVGVLDPFEDKKNLNELTEYPTIDVPIFKTKEDVLSVQPDVWIDFTIPKVAYENTRFAIEHKIAPVVGTTGLTEEQLGELIERSETLKVGGLIAPNFAVGAVLMMQFAQKAAEYFPDVEIIELHHDNKLDAPSGTAIKTAEMMSAVRAKKSRSSRRERIDSRCTWCGF